jgi:hypothetical protein
MKITGHIYLIVNTITQKKYVGQTLSHRKNRGQYKLFGYEGRFRDHLSEAICNTKKKQCRYLNNAIRLYGKEAFIVSLLTECSLDELDPIEQKYIESENTLYPNGYNLTKGGKGAKAVKTGDDVDKLHTETPRKRGGCKERSTETRSKISQQLKKSMENDQYRNDLMKRTQVQHYSQKIKRFEGVKIDTTNLDQYIYERKHSIIIKINNIRTTFAGKFETKETLRIRAQEFLKQIAITAMLPNCSGNP